MFDADAAADDAWKTVRSVAEFDARRLAMRRTMVGLIGGFPERTPLNAKVTGVVRRDGYRVEKILFESRPGMYVTGLLYLPDSPRFAAPYPAALEVCGHSFLGKNCRNYQRVAVLAAKAGVAAFVIDPFGQGERFQCAEDDNLTTKNHLRLGVNALLLGHGLAAFEMWDAMRALDCLETRPELRHDGFGVMGNSGGGTQSVILSALDDRIKATATCCFLSNLREQNAWRLLADSEQLIFAQLRHGLNHVGYPLLGGNPVLMLSRRDELIPFTGTRETFRVLTAVGRNLGRPDWYGMYDLPGPHGYNERNMRRSAAYLAERLRGEQAVFPPEATPDDGPTAPENLVTPTGRVMDLDGFRSAYDYLAEELSAAEKARKSLSAADRAGLVRRLADIDESRLGGRTVVSETELDGGVRVFRGFFEAVGGYRVPTVEFVPSAVRGAPVLAVGDDSRTNRLPFVREALAKGRPVLVADVLATGEIGRKRHIYVNPHEDEETAKMLYILGSSLVGRRAGEIVALGRSLADRYGRAPSVVAVGRTAVAAAHASAASPGIFADVTVVGAPLSWSESVRTRAFYDYAAAVHGGLLHYDWPDLLNCD